MKATQEIAALESQIVSVRVVKSSAVDLSDKPIEVDFPWLVVLERQTGSVKVYSHRTSKDAHAQASDWLRIAAHQHDQEGA